MDKFRVLVFNNGTNMAAVNCKSVPALAPFHYSGKIIYLSTSVLKKNPDAFRF